MSSGVSLRRRRRRAVSLSPPVLTPASVAGHSVVNGLAPHLPSGYRILLVERNEFVHHNPCVVRSLVRPGWDMTNFTAPVRQETIFPAGSRHRVLAPNRVVKLRRTSVWLEQPFEGVDEVEFEVSRGAEPG